MILFLVVSAIQSAPNGSTPVDSTASIVNQTVALVPMVFLLEHLCPVSYKDCCLASILFWSCYFSSPTVDQTTLIPSSYDDIYPAHINQSWTSPQYSSALGYRIAYMQWPWSHPKFLNHFIPSLMNIYIDLPRWSIPSSTGAGLPDLMKLTGGRASTQFKYFPSLEASVHLAIHASMRRPGRWPLLRASLDFLIKIPRLHKALESWDFLSCSIFSRG